MDVIKLAKYLSDNYKHVEVYYFNNAERAYQKYHELNTLGYKAWISKANTEIPLLVRTCSTSKLDTYLQTGLVAALVIVIPCT
jgi:hypothetical protein